MDRLARLPLLLLAVAALPLAAVAQTGVVELEPTKTISIVCAVDGSNSAVITTLGRVEYELVAADDLVMCEGATCSTGGTDRPKGNHGVIYVPGGRVYSCRSLSGSAKLSFTPVVVRR